MCPPPPQGIPSGDILRVPTAPYREPPKPPSSGHAGFDRVAQLALLARGWLKAQGLPHSADAVIAMAALAMTAERDAREAEKPRQVPPAPGHARRRASPPAGKDQP